MTFHRLRPWVLAIALALAPAAVAAAWVPLRTDLPNTDVALLLVVSVAAVATVGGTGVAVAAAFAAVVSFDYFDTAPYGRLLIARTSDEVTAGVLLAAGLVVGTMAAGRRRYRRESRRGQEDFTVMASAARLVSLGEDSSMVVGALAGELTSRLDLNDSEFVARPPTGDRPFVTRDGRIAGVDPGRTVTELDLPVWVGDQAVAHFHLTLKGPGLPPSDRLQAAVGIAEQAGAVLAGWPGPRPPDGHRPRRLRLVR